MDMDKGTQDPATSEVPEKLTLDDLLTAESEVLRRIGREIEENVTPMGGHSSTTSGHRSSGTHTSHSSAKVERPLQG